MHNLLYEEFDMQDNESASRLCVETGKKASRKLPISFISYSWYRYTRSILITLRACLCKEKFSLVGELPSPANHLVICHQAFI